LLAGGAGGPPKLNEEEALASTLQRKKNKKKSKDDNQNQKKRKTRGKKKKKRWLAERPRTWHRRSYQFVGHYDLHVALIPFLDSDGRLSPGCPTSNASINPSLPHWPSSSSKAYDPYWQNAAVLPN
jgi:hypothetical protein